MKKFAAVLIAGGILLGACSNDEEAKEETPKAEETAENSQTEAGKEKEENGVDVDKGLFNVEVTLPASFFEGEDMESVMANAEAEGVGEATVNNNGSVTYKMSKSKHSEMMDEIAKSVEESKNEIVDSGDFPSVQAVDTNKDYSKFTVSVDREAFEKSLDGFATMSLGLVGSYYQAFDGTAPEKLHVEIDLKDAATGEVYNTIVYPDVLEKMGE